MARSRAFPMTMIWANNSISPSTSVLWATVTGSSYCGWRCVCLILKRTLITGAIILISSPIRMDLLWRCVTLFSHPLLPPPPPPLSTLPSRGRVVGYGNLMARQCLELVSGWVAANKSWDTFQVWGNIFYVETRNLKLFTRVLYRLQQHQKQKCVNISSTFSLLNKFSNYHQHSGALRCAVCRIVTARDQKYTLLSSRGRVEHLNGPRQLAADKEVFNLWSLIIIIYIIPKPTNPLVLPSADDHHCELKRLL